jgi:hypothetical protein
MKTKFKIVKIAAITPPIAAIQRFPVSASLVDGSSADLVSKLFSAYVVLAITPLFF